MNDLSSPVKSTATPPSASIPLDATLPPATRLGAFEITRLIARSASTSVYLATDHALAMPVAIQEYLPARLVRRDKGLQLRALDVWHEDLVGRGLRAFVDESRLLARCDHPSLVRVIQLFESNGTAYRVMPVYDGQRLSDLRREMVGAPDESAVRALFDGLLGALETIHRSGHVHGAVSPSNILLLADDRPLLLGPGAAGREIGSDLVDSLMATLASSPVAGSADGGGTAPTGAAGDLYALAATLRFCITGETLVSVGTLRAREPLADAIARAFIVERRPQYGAALLVALDAALSPFAEDRPLNAAQFREWATRGLPGGPTRMPAEARKLAAAPATTFAAAAAAVPAAAAVSMPMPMPTRVPSTGAPQPAAQVSRRPPASMPPTPPTPPIPPMAPMAPWPADAIDRIEPVRPAWVAPPLPPQLQRATTVRARRRKSLIAAGFAGLAMTALAATLASGWWGPVPDIRFGPVAERTDASPGETPTTEARASVEPPVAGPLPMRAASGADAAPAAASVSLPASASASASVQASTSSAAPSPSSVSTPTPTPTPTPTSESDSSSDSSPDPVPVIAPVGAGTAVAAPSPAPVPTPRRPQTQEAAAAPFGSPRSACGSRTEFALYRCMQQQCSSKQWSLHPQCVRLRTQDEVD